MRPLASLVTIDVCDSCLSPDDCDTFRNAGRPFGDTRDGDGDRDGTRTTARHFVWNPRLMPSARWFVDGSDS